MTKLSSVGLLSLVGVSLVAGDHYSCDQMKKLSHEYFPESVADNMICLSFHSNGWNSISNTKNSIGLWNVRKDFCHSLCSSICKDPKDLYKPEINAQCAEMIYTEFGYNHWDAWNKGKCNGWNQCGISTSVNGDDKVGAAITGSGGVSGSGSGSVVDVKDNSDVNAAITGSGGVSGSDDDVIKAAITGSGGVSGDNNVKAAITGSGGVSGGNDDDDVQAAITGTGSSGSGSTIPVKAAITGTGSSGSGSGTTIPVKSEIFSATGDSTIPVLEDVQAAITGSGGVSGSGSGSTIPVKAAITGTGSSGSGTTIPVKSEIFSATGDSNIPVLEDVQAAITGSGGVSGSGSGSVIDVKDNGDVNAAITGSGGVSGDNDFQAALTGSGGVSGSGSTIPVKAAITGTGSSGSGTTIPVKSETFSATGDSTIPV
ncbi:hypothetical protein ACTFIZ_007884 [Dictyostelium cf. discoideum]